MTQKYEEFQTIVRQFGKIAMQGNSTKSQLRSRLDGYKGWYFLSDEEYTYCVGMIADFGL